MASPSPPSALFLKKKKKKEKEKAWRVKSAAVGVSLGANGF